MANLVETDEFTPGIHQFEIADAPEGGEGGIDNLVNKQIVNRTLWLKNRLAEHAAALDPHPQYMTTDESDVAIAAAVAAVVNSSPAALDTLNELALALGNDANFAATLTAALATKLTEQQANALYAPVGFTVAVRQTVLSGNVDVSGYASFGGAAGSAIVTTATTLKATAAYADTNRVGSIVNPQWTGLNTNGTMYLGLTINADGTCTPFATSLAPVYQWGGAYATTAGQRTFNIQEMTMKVGNGAAAVQSYDVFVGEVTVVGGVVTAITWYSLMGRYMSAPTAISGNILYSFAHRIGLSPSQLDLDAWVRDTTNDYILPYHVNSSIDQASSYNNYAFSQAGAERNSFNVRTPSYILNYVSASGAVVQRTSAEITIRMKRGW